MFSSIGGVNVMGMGRLFFILGLLVLNFVGTIFLESRLQQYAVLELVIIVVGILLSILAIVGIATEVKWAWPFATILFALSLANVVFLHVNINAFLTFVILLFVNVFGLLVSVLSIEDDSDMVELSEDTTTSSVPLETYSLASEPTVTYKTGGKPVKSKKKH